MKVIVILIIIVSCYYSIAENIPDYKSNIFDGKNKSSRNIFDSVIDSFINVFKPMTFENTVAEYTTQQSSYDYSSNDVWEESEPGSMISSTEDSLGLSDYLIGNPYAYTTIDFSEYWDHYEHSGFKDDDAQNSLNSYPVEASNNNIAPVEFIPYTTAKLEPADRQTKGKLYATINDKQPTTQSTRGTTMPTVSSTVKNLKDYFSNKMTSYADTSNNLSTNLSSTEQSTSKTTLSFVIITRDSKYEEFFNEDYSKKPPQHQSDSDTDHYMESMVTLPRINMSLLFAARPITQKNYVTLSETDQNLNTTNFSNLSTLVDSYEPVTIDSLTMPGLDLTITTVSNDPSSITLIMNSNTNITNNSTITSVTTPSNISLLTTYAPSTITISDTNIANNITISLTNTPSTITISRTNTPSTITVSRTDTPSTITVPRTNTPSTITVSRTDTPSTITVPRTNTPSTITVSRTDTPSTITVQRTDTPSTITISSTNTPRTITISKTIIPNTIALPKTNTPRAYKTTRKTNPITNTPSTLNGSNRNTPSTLIITNKTILSTPDLSNLDTIELNRNIITTKNKVDLNARTNYNKQITTSSDSETNTNSPNSSNQFNYIKLFDLTEETTSKWDQIGIGAEANLTTTTINSYTSSRIKNLNYGKKLILDKEHNLDYTDLMESYKPIIPDLSNLSDESGPNQNKTKLDIKIDELLIKVAKMLASSSTTTTTAKISQPDYDDMDDTIFHTIPRLDFPKIPTHLPVEHVKFTTLYTQAPFIGPKMSTRGVATNAQQFDPFSSTKKMSITTARIILTTSAPPFTIDDGIIVNAEPFDPFEAWTTSDARDKTKFRSSTYSEATGEQTTGTLSTQESSTELNPNQINNEKQTNGTTKKFRFPWPSRRTNYSTTLKTTLNTLPAYNFENDPDNYIDDEDELYDKMNNFKPTKSTRHTLLPLLAVPIKQQLAQGIKWPKQSTTMNPKFTDTMIPLMPGPTRKLTTTHRPRPTLNLSWLPNWVVSGLQIKSTTSKPEQMIPSSGPNIYNNNNNTTEKEIYSSDKNIFNEPGKYEINNDLSNSTTDHDHITGEYRKNNTNISTNSNNYINEGWYRGNHSGQSFAGVGSHNGQGGIVIGSNSGNGRRPARRPFMLN